VAWADGWTISSPLDTGLNASADASSSGRFYLTPEVGWQVQNLPKFSIGSVSPTNSQAFYSTNLNVEGAQGGLALGYLLPGNPLGGRNSRAELSANFYSLTGGTGQAFTSPSPNTQWVYVGGGQPSTTTFGVYSTSVDARLSGGELAARVAADYPLTANFTVTPGIALFGGWSRLGVDYIDTEDCSGGLCFVDTQTHRIRSAEIGSTVSIGSRLTITPVMSLLLGGGAGLAYINSQLSASDCFDETIGPGCQPAAFDAGFLTASHATASHAGIGYRLMGQAGLRYLLGPAEINLLGGVRYGPMPTINNPSSPAQAVSLSSTQQLGYTVMLSVRIPFGGG
jgi:hypothetical protein